MFVAPVVSVAGELPKCSGDIGILVAPALTIAGVMPKCSGVIDLALMPVLSVAGELPRASGAVVIVTPSMVSIAGELPRASGQINFTLPPVSLTIDGELPKCSGVFGDWPVLLVSAELPKLSGVVSAWCGAAASGIWLYLHTSPPAQVFSLDAIRGRLNPYLPTHRIDDLNASPLQAQTGRQNESWSVALTGASAALRARCAAQAPFGVKAELFDGGELLREGITDGLDYKGRTLSLTLQSAGWTVDLPIRTTADLGTFRDVEPVAWRYGRNVSGALVSIDSTRKRFVWADHPCQAIRSLTTSDGEPGPAFEMRNQPDSTGRPICVVLTAEQVEDGVELIAVGDGAMDAASGDLLTNPADIVRDIINKSGRTISKGQLARFRRDCLARGLELSNSISGGTLQAAVESIAASVHAVFARSHRELLRLLPITGAVAGTLDARYLEGRTSDSDDIATRLLVRYALEDGKPRASLEVRATAVELAHGIRPKTITLDWIQDDRSAADVGERKLQDDARPSYKLTYSAVQRQWTPGETATVSDPGLGLSGTALVESVNGFAPTARLRIGNAPTVALAALSAAYVPEPISLGSTSLTNGGRMFTFNDSDGRPAVGARCTLDGGVTRVTDGTGTVSFPDSLLRPGPHTIVVAYQDIPPYPYAFTI